MAGSKKTKDVILEGANGEVIENKGPEKIRTGIQRRMAIL